MALPPMASAYSGPSKVSILETRKANLGYNCALNYSKSPLLIVSGKGQHLYDEVRSVLCMRSEAGGRGRMADPAGWL